MSGIGPLLGLDSTLRNFMYGTKCYHRVLNSQSRQLRIVFLKRMSEVRNGEQNGHKHFGHYVVSINTIFFHICTLKFNKLNGRTKPYFILFFKLNDHQTRYFSFGLRRFYSNGCKFKLN